MRSGRKRRAWPLDPDPNTLEGREYYYWRRHVILSLVERFVKMTEIAKVTGLSNSRVAQLRDHALRERKRGRTSPMEREKYEGGEVWEMAQVLMGNRIGRQILGNNAWKSRRGICVE